MTLAHRFAVRRRLLLVPVAGFALATAACGGGSSGGSPHSSGMPGMTSSGMTSSGMPGRTSSGTAGMPGTTGMATYSPVTPGPAAPGAHNDADVRFASEMIPHHGQAVQMADLIIAKTTNARVKAFAERIKAAQSPEIATMAGWLKGWGSAVPDPYASMAGMAGMERGGMMTDEQMARLGKASGVEADKLFLTLMGQHHAGAVLTATGEAASGSNPEAKKLAQSIVIVQTAEIAVMKEMLAALG